MEELKTHQWISFQCPDKISAQSAEKINQYLKSAWCKIITEGRNTVTALMLKLNMHAWSPKLQSVANLREWKKHAHEFKLIPLLSDVDGIMLHTTTAQSRQYHTTTLYAKIAFEQWQITLAPEYCEQHTTITTLDSDARVVNDISQVQTRRHLIFSPGPFMDISLAYIVIYSDSNANDYRNPELFRNVLPA